VLAPHWPAAAPLLLVTALRHGALGAAINGPKLLMLDWMALPNGVKRDFNGKKVPWVALLHLAKEEVEEMGTFRNKTTTIERKSKFGINTGTHAILGDRPSEQNTDSSLFASYRGISNGKSASHQYRCRTKWRSTSFATPSNIACKIDSQPLPMAPEQSLEICCFTGKNNDFRGFSAG